MKRSTYLYLSIVVVFNMIFTIEYFSASFDKIKKQTLQPAVARLTE